MKLCLSVCFLRYGLSEALPWCDVIDDPRAAVGHVLQGWVRVVKRWRVALFLDVVWQQVGKAERRHTNPSECCKVTCMSHFGLHLRILCMWFGLKWVVMHRGTSSKARCYISVWLEFFFSPLISDVYIPPYSRQ